MNSPADILRFFRPEGLLPAILIIGAAWALAHGISYVATRLSKRFVDRRLLLQQMKSVLRLITFVVSLLAAASLLFHLSNEALIALGGTTAVAMGFAFKDLLASMIAGVIILADRPFQVGDRVTFGGYYGEVVEIGLRTVRLVTLDDSLVTIHNNKFLTEPVASGNAGALEMLVQIDFFVGSDQDIALAKRLLGESVTSSSYTYLDKPWTIVITPIQMGDALAARLRAKVYVLDVKYEKALETDVTEQAMQAFREHGIAPPAILHRSVQAA